MKPLTNDFTRGFWSGLSFCLFMVFLDRMNKLESPVEDAFIAILALIAMIINIVTHLNATTKNGQQ